jgi:hypothetical protein
MEKSENNEAMGLGSEWSGASREVVSSGSTLKLMNSPILMTLTH